jgi:triosephosphate isomerase
MHAHIRGIIAHHYGKVRADRLRIQYGGSLKPGVAEEIFIKPNIDGGLIGGASLKAAEFVTIVKASAAAGKARNGGA